MFAMQNCNVAVIMRLLAKHVNVILFSDKLYLNGNEVVCNHDQIVKV